MGVVRIVAIWLGALSAAVFGLVGPDVIDLPANVSLFLLWGAGALTAVSVGLTIWSFVPKSKRPSPAEYWSMRQWHRYMVNDSDWSRRTGKFERPDFEKLGLGPHFAAPRHLAAITEFQKQAQRENSHLRVWGVPNGYGGAALIPHSYWMTHGLEYDSILDPNSQNAKTERKVGFGPDERYEFVKIERAGIIRTWPRMSFIDRFKRRLSDGAEQCERAKVENEVRQAVSRANEEPDFDMPLKDVVQRITGLPDKVFADNAEPASGETCILEISDALDALRERMRNEMVKHVWARELVVTVPGDRERIDAGYWKGHEIDVVEFMQDHRGESVSKYVGAKDYVDFWFWRAEIDRHWPPRGAG